MAMAPHLHRALAPHGIRKFVQAGTICACPKFTPVPFHEGGMWDGYPEETNAPYGVAMMAAMVMLDGYRLHYGLASSYLLPVNLYDPWDNFDPKKLARESRAYPKVHRIRGGRRRPHDLLGNRQRQPRDSLGGR